MLRAKRIWQWMRSMSAGVWQHAIRLMSKLSSLLAKAKSREPDKLIMPLGVLIGTVAFGLWSQSFATSLLALIVLCFLAGIYKTNQQLLAALRKVRGCTAVWKRKLSPVLRADSGEQCCRQRGDQIVEALACERSVSDRGKRERVLCRACRFASSQSSSRDRREFHMTSRPNKNAGCILPLNLTSFLL
jgi:hypothetical protein